MLRRDERRLIKRFLIQSKEKAVALMVNKMFVRNFFVFFVLLLACVGSLGYYIISSTEELDETDNWVFHSQSVIIQSEDLIATVQALVAAQRGFLLSGDEDFMAAYKENRQALSADIANLKELTKDNPSHQSRLEELHHSILKFADFLEDTVARNAALPVESRRILTEKELLMGVKDNIVRIANEVVQEEYAILTARTRQIERQTRRYQNTLLVGGAVATVLLLLFNSFLLNAQSKRSQAEQTLKEVKDRLYLAIRGSNDGIFDWHFGTNDLYWSPQYKAMLGYSEDELLASIDTFNSLLHPDDKDELWKVYDDYIKGNTSEFAHMFRMRHKSGRWIWMHARGKATYDREGKPERLIGAHTDITHMKEYERKLTTAKDTAEKANVAKREFLAHMSHEIRTPLTAISGIAEIFEKDSDKFDEKHRKLVRTLGTSAASLKDLITDILDFSKIESGEIELHKQDFRLGDLCEQVVSIMAMRAAEKGLDFGFDYAAIRDMSYYGDKARLRQILINLVGNAVKFTDKGFVKVNAVLEREGDQPVLKIEVADSGIGITPASKDTIFEKFRQADSSVSRRYGGTGLGLPISKSLAELMGGYIDLTSAVGIGSTFTLMLPFVAGASVAQQSRGPGDLPQPVLNRADPGTAILLAEDYEGNIIVLSHIIEELGFDFDVARTGTQAVDLWKSKRYDLVLMDVQMPEMDGLAATRAIRTLEEERGEQPTPIIGLTAHALVADKQKCIDSGMSDYLSKPIDEASLRRVILEHINKKQLGKDQAA